MMTFPSNNHFVDTNKKLTNNQTGLNRPTFYTIMSNKLFCGRGKAFGQYGSIALSICLDDLPDEHVTTGKNGKRYIKLNVNEKRETDEWGNTHSVEVDTWKPDNRPAQQANARPAPNLKAQNARPAMEDADDELGF